jgi:hypothetical protein
LSAEAATRPAIDAKVFAFVEAQEFARRDFPQSGYNVHRLSRDVTQLLLHKASLPAREIEGRRSGWSSGSWPDTPTSGLASRGDESPLPRAQMGLWKTKFCAV